LKDETRFGHVSHIPIEALGTFEVSGADGTYSILVVQGSTHQKDENRNGHVKKAFSNPGNGRF